jgi:hypothetical protein
VGGKKVEVLGRVFLSDRSPTAARPFFRPRDTLRPEHCHPFAVQIEIHQGEVRAQPMMVLGDASIPHLVEAVDLLQDAERMLDLGPYAQLRLGSSFL